MKTDSTKAKVLFILFVMEDDSVTTRSTTDRDSTHHRPQQGVRTPGLWM